MAARALGEAKMSYLWRDGSEQGSDLPDEETVAIEVNSADVERATQVVEDALADGEWFRRWRSIGRHGIVWEEAEAGAQGDVAGGAGGGALLPEYHRATPECPQPERWSMYDSMTAEAEVLEFLRTLVTTVKPELVVETGSFLGVSTLWIAEGMKANGFGKIVSCEYRPDGVCGGEGED